MDVKFGKLRPSGSQNIFSSQPQTSAQSEENFFANPSQMQSDETTSKASTGKLNDFDSNILEQNAYKEIPDEMFKLEYKIDATEKYLIKINNEIKSLESMGADIQISALKARKKQLEDDLVELNLQYSKLGIGSNFSNKIASVIKSSTNNDANPINKAKRFINREILTKLSKKISYNESMKDALKSLSDINASVDELINLQTPYGETIERYQKLTTYLNEANRLHAQISKNIADMSVAKKVV